MKAPYAYRPTLSELLTGTDEASLLRAEQAAHELLECERVLAKCGLTVLTELLKGHDKLAFHEHYPDNDIIDSEFGALAYFHSHAREHEYGHFHTYLSASHFAPEVEYIEQSNHESYAQGDDSHSHLIAVSMNDSGRPIRLFTVNAWVGHEPFFRDADVVKMIDQFKLDHADPSWPLNRWLTALLSLFKPQIEHLILQREPVLQAHQAAHPDENVFWDESLEVLGECSINVAAQIQAISKELDRRGLANALKVKAKASGE